MCPKAAVTGQRTIAVSRHLGADPGSDIHGHCCSVCLLNVGLRGARTQVSRGLLSRTSVHNSCSTLTLLGPFIVTRSFHTFSYTWNCAGSCIRAHVVIPHIVCNWLMLYACAVQCCGCPHPWVKWSTCGRSEPSSTALQV